jgi:predicted transcriptional regulator
VGGKMDWLANGLPREGRDATRPRAGDLARHAVPACLPSETIGQVERRTREAGWDRCVVVNEHRVVLGLLGPAGWDADPTVTAEQVMELGPSTFRPNVSLGEMAKYMRDHEMDGALITTSDGVLMGLLCREDAERAADGEMATARGRTGYVQGR